MLLFDVSSRLGSYGVGPYRNILKKCRACKCWHMALKIVSATSLENSLSSSSATFKS